MIKISIAVNKVDKTKFFVKKNGDKMLDMVLIETPQSKYDQDYMIVQDSSKEDRDAGKKGNILGNGKIIESKGNRGNGGGKPAAKGDEDEW
jgi:GT2 family glycosyltransferase